MHAIALPRLQSTPGVTIDLDRVAANDALDVNALPLPLAAPISASPACGASQRTHADSAHDDGAHDDGAHDDYWLGGYAGI